MIVGVEPDELYPVWIRDDEDGRYELELSDEFLERWQKAEAEFMSCQSFVNDAINVLMG